MFLALLLVVIFTNLINVFFGFDKRFFLASGYYLYNFLIYFIFLYFFTKYKNKSHLIQISISISVFIQFFYLIFFPVGHRLEGTFNNPNQLGFWALLNLIFYFITLRNYKSLGLKELFTILLIIFCLVVSLSKAAILSAVFAILIFFITKFKIFLKLKSAFLIFLVSLIPIFFPTTINETIEKPLEKLESRLSSLGKSDDDNLEGRNYDRLYYYPERLIFGSGEGNYGRFALRGKSNEIHSTYATLLFSYGLIGFILFMFFLLLNVWNVGISFSFYIIPILMFGVTHNGLRFSLFWILLAYINSFSHKNLYTSFSSKHG